MAQGFPVSPEEKKKIFEFHKAGYFPSQIAVYLSKYYSELNGGYRSTKTVNEVINAGNQPEPIMIQPTEPLPDLSPEAEPKPRKVPDMRKGNGRRKV